MKILWATPFHEASAIARFSIGVIAELRNRGHQVGVLRLETGGSLELAPVDDAMIVPAEGEQHEEWLRSADIVFANLGDHYGNHGGFFDLARRRAVVGILHDWCLINFFWNWLVVTGRESQIGKFILDWYGAAAYEEFSQIFGENMLASAARHFPMTECVVSKLMGAVIHSEFYRDRVESGCAGPVVRLPLAYPPLSATCVERQVRSDGKCVVSTFGIVNPNKRVDLVIAAIAGDAELRRRVVYKVLGAISEEQSKRLQSLADSYGYTGLVLEGHVSRSRLIDGLAETDIICCLRDPALEGASASAIEGLQSGAPIIVSDTGFYAEIPDRYVVKIPLGDDPSLLREQIRSLSAHPEQALARGREARAWAVREYSCATYVDGLEQHFDEYLAAEPYIGLAGMLGKELGNMGLSRKSAVVARTGQLLRQAFALEE